MGRLVRRLNNLLDNHLVGIQDLKRNLEYKPLVNSKSLSLVWDLRDIALKGFL